MNAPRLRIKEHRLVRASELIPHPLNPRVHPEFQSRVLSELLGEIGIARSLLAYETAEGKLCLIDGHLRKEILAEAEVIVEVLDVTEEEARSLLLSLDPLSALAVNDQPVLEQLKKQAATSSTLLRQMWESIGQSQAECQKELAKHPKDPELKPQFLILVQCPSEEDQAQLLTELQGRGISCKALIS